MTKKINRKKTQKTSLGVICIIIISGICIVFVIYKQYTEFRYLSKFNSLVSILEFEEFLPENLATYVVGKHLKNFDGGKKRKYPVGLRRFLQRDGENDAELKYFSVPENTCEQWFVLTSSSKSSQNLQWYGKVAADQTLSGEDKWCCLIVGDKESTANVTEVDGCFYLGTDEQELLPYRSTRLLPRNHFGRKNIGYLFAIHHGAKYIFDADDYNSFNVPTIPVLSSNSKFSKIEVAQTEGTLLNPYPLFGPNILAWPRGFPLDKVTEDGASSECTLPLTLEQIISSDMGGLNVAVIQFLANGNPDLDSLYRLSQKHPITFSNPCEHELLVIPPGVASPYNSKATLHTYASFFGLRLPISVHERVSDIWRGYFAQFILWRLGLALAFYQPAIDWRWDELKEKHLKHDYDSYQKSSLLVNLISNWVPSATSLPELMEELAIEFYEREYWEKTDVQLIQAWIADLRSLDYKFADLNPPAQVSLTACLKSMERCTGSIQSWGSSPGSGSITLKSSNAQTLQTASEKTCCPAMPRMSQEQAETEKEKRSQLVNEAVQARSKLLSSRLTVNSGKSAVDAEENAGTGIKFIPTLPDSENENNGFYYVLINQPEGERKIDLAEIELHYRGVKIPSSELHLQFTSQPAPTEQCHDGSTKNHCESSASDKDPLLMVKSNSKFDRIVVHNRHDCCASRIVGANIAATTNGGVSWWKSTFQSETSKYEFETTLYRIIITQPTRGQPINLAEVEIFDRGSQISSYALYFHMSGNQGENPYPPSRCNNGQLYDFCHSDGQDRKPTLTIISDSEFDQIIVHNRKDCCSARIVGATIAATTDGGLTWRRSAFQSDELLYTFNLGSSSSMIVIYGSEFDASAALAQKDLQIQENFIREPDTVGIAVDKGAGKRNEDEYQLIISQPNGEHVLNLAEVQLFNKGIQLPSSVLHFKMSGDTIASLFPVEKCYNGILTDFCHSDKTDPNPTLIINSDAPFDKIVVYNRKDCCTERILDASISATSDGGISWWKSYFETEAPTYTFFTDFAGLYRVVINQLVDERVINLAEVQLLYKGARLRTSSLQFELSTTRANLFAENCNNENLNDFCHTGENDRNPTLIIVADTVFDQIIVNNRKDCCQKRILGAQISATLNGGATWWKTSFDDESDPYIFYPTFEAAVEGRVRSAKEKKAKFADQVMTVADPAKVLAIAKQSTGTFQIIIHQPTGEKILNLAEVEVFYQSFQLILSSLHFQMSGDMTDAFFPVTNCNNGFYFDFCHSNREDFSPTLSIASDAIFDQIKVHNRQSCCSRRIIGATILATTDAGATWWTSSFEVDAPSYTFTIGSPASVDKGETPATVKAQQQESRLLSDNRKDVEEWTAPKVSGGNVDEVKVLDLPINPAEQNPTNLTPKDTVTTGKYWVLIHQPHGDRIINLAEIKLFYQDVEIPASSLHISISGSPVSECNDGSLKTYCKSNEEDPDPKLKVVSDTIFDHVMVYNRQDWDSDQILGASISATLDDGQTWFFQHVVEENYNTYTFKKRPYWVVIEQLTGDRIINLADVELYSGGKQIPSNRLSFSMSEQDASLCNDGLKNNFCHSAKHDRTPRLKIISDAPFDKVVVHNRASCCQERIIGATISATIDEGRSWLFQRTFETGESVQTFQAAQR